MGDPEIEAMSAVATALADLEESARERILHWAAERYGVTLPTGGPRGGGASDGGAGNNDYEGAGDVTEREITDKAPSYEHFAELFAAASPKSNEDRRWRPRTGYRFTRARTRGSPGASTPS